MALHKDLPVYKLAYDLLCLATDLTRNMPRDFKASLGGRLRDECLNVLLAVARANASHDKAPHLTLLLENLQVAELLLRLAHDKRFISNAQYARSVQVTESVGAQVGGWKRQQLQQLEQRLSPVDEQHQHSLFSQPAQPVA